MTTAATNTAPTEADTAASFDVELDVLAVMSNVYCTEEGLSSYVGKATITMLTGMSNTAVKLAHDVKLEENPASVETAHEIPTWLLSAIDTFAAAEVAVYACCADVNGMSTVEVMLSISMGTEMKS